MGKKDSRRLSADEQYRMRKQVVQLREKGMRNQEISQTVGLCVSHVSTIWQHYRKGGLDAIGLKVRGRRYGAQRKLSADQEEAVKRLLSEEAPRQLGLHLHLWTRETIRSAIKLKLGVDLPARTTSDYLQRWGFVPKRPVYGSDGNDATGIERQQELHCLEMQDRAKSEKSEIHWMNMTTCGSSDATNDGSATMISTVTNKGKTRFLLFRGALNEDIFSRFLYGLIRDCDRRVLLMVYYHPVHYKGLVHHFLLKNVQKIALHYLPSSLPEHTPDETMKGEIDIMNRALELAAKRFNLTA